MTIWTRHWSTRKIPVTTSGCTPASFIRIAQGSLPTYPSSPPRAASVVPLATAVRHSELYCVSRDRSLRRCGSPDYYRGPEARSTPLHRSFSAMGERKIPPNVSTTNFEHDTPVMKWICPGRLLNKDNKAVSVKSITGWIYSALLDLAAVRCSCKNLH